MMKKVGVGPLLILCAFLCNCANGVDIKKETNKKIVSDLEKELKGLYGESLNVECQLSSDTLNVNLSELPELKTGEEYNQLLMAYVAYNCASFIHSNGILKMNIKHKFNGIEYFNFYQNDGRFLAVYNDFTKEKYKEVVEYLLIEFGDSESAYFDLSMEEAKKIFPKVAMSNESIYSLLTRQMFIGDNKVYTKEESDKIRFEIRLFYWVSEFPFGDLKFEKNKLDKVLVLMGSKPSEWSKKSLDEMYLTL